MIFSSNVLKRWSFQKELSWGMTFLVLSGRWYFFPKNMIFFLERKVRDDLSQKIHGNMIFSVCTHGCYKRGTTPLLPRPPCQENQRWSYPTKIHLKMIYFLDLHSRKSSGNSRYFRGDPYRRFHALLSSEKTQET